MREFIADLLLLACLIMVVAAAAILPSVAVPESEAVYQRGESAIPYGDTFDVIVQGEGVAAPGRYTFAYGVTYGEMFSAMGLSEVPDGFDGAARVRMTDAVLLDGEYVIYLVL